jgi:hypothetical protein
MHSRAIGVAICYDRHYPEYMRALAVRGAEVVFVPQAGAVDEWPEGLYEGEMRVAAFQNGYFVACAIASAAKCDVCRRVLRVRAGQRMIAKDRSSKKRLCMTSFVRRRIARAASVPSAPAPGTLRRVGGET